MNPDQSLAFDIEDVIRLVYSINLARGVDSEGHSSYISTQYVSIRITEQCNAYAKDCLFVRWATLLWQALGSILRSLRVQQEDQNWRFESNRDSRFNHKRCRFAGLHFV